MDLRPRGHDKVIRLIEKGVTVPNPFTLDIGDEVDVSRISGDGVILHAGCRIRGAKTVISAGVTLGSEGPATIDDCWLGPDVDLKGGYFCRSVFLEKASLGLGAEVREGCVVEEQVSGAHCVGLKQTILFPFVTLGSLVNFCDCLMAGGSSRRQHSEVGSSYIHFNFTPDGDKATASLFGDVPRGVMLDRPPVFLGGQGGAVGPVRVGFGTVVAAGSILRRDVLEDGRFVVPGSPAGLERDHLPRDYKNPTRVVRNNVLYLANLVALEEWYKRVRTPFFAQQEMGGMVLEGALEVLSLAKRERQARLRDLAERAVDSYSGTDLVADVAEVCALFDDPVSLAVGDGFFDALGQVAEPSQGSYLETVCKFTPEVRALGVQWLQGIVDSLSARADDGLPSLGLFKHKQ